MIVAQAIASEFSTPESRQEIGNLVTAVPPILAGLAGRAVNVEALGGYIQYKYGGFFPLVTALWSILALSGTLADEVRRGSMEILAASPVTRRRIAIEKLAGHVVMLTLAMAFVFVATAAAGTFGTLPGDEIPVQAAFGFAAWLWLTALVAGSLAFALAPVRRSRVGRGHRRCRDVRRLPAQRLPDGDPRAGAVREPHLVRLDDQPSPARRLVRLGLVAARRGRDRRVPRDRRGGVRPP